MIVRDFLSRLSAAPTPSAQGMPAPTVAANMSGSQPSGRRMGLGGYFADGNRMMQPSGSPMAGSSFGAAQPAGAGSFGGMASPSPAAPPASPSPSPLPNNFVSAIPSPFQPRTGFQSATQQMQMRNPLHQSLLEQLMRGFG